MLKRLVDAFPGVYTEKIAEVERFCHWKERRGKVKKRGAVMRQPEFRSMFAVLNPGKWKITNYDDWDQDMPFGKCPACGSLGREDVPGAECPMAWFRCTDDSCYTRLNPEIPSEITDEMQRAFFYQRMCGIRGTLWSDMKPDWWLKMQAAGEVYSWNWAIFSVEYCEQYDLI